MTALSLTRHILREVQKTPHEYIADKSIRLLRAFWDGYVNRIIFEEKVIVRINKNFQVWIEDKFNINLSQSWGNIILLYSLDDAEAFDRFFALSQEFIQETGDEILECFSPVTTPPNKNILQVLGEIKAMPEPYLGEASFELCGAYVDGYIRAGEDLGRPKSVEENLFSSFTQDIEQQKLTITGPSWKKIIRFYSNSDGAENGFGALAIFFKWLDSFLISAGFPSLG